jgi:translocation and assembly module TamB
MEAAYSLAGVPLALANVLGSPDMPLKFAGEIDGRGELRRTPQGELFGAAQIRSAGGRVARQTPGASHESPAEPPQVLLSYGDLNLTANLAGASARATVNVRVNDDGSVNGEATLRGLGQQETAVAGQASVSIPDLAPFAVLAPQVANVHGRVDARAKIAGALQAPEIVGEVTASALAADVPAAGLHLKAGRLQVRPAATGEFDIAGSVSSGDGHLELGGKASVAGDVDLRLNGERFVAADIPGARVIVSPALQFARAAEQMTLKGDVTIPQADVNLQKLPRGDRARSASPDVVIVDAQTQEQAELEKTPLKADINVILGEKVNLTGFGLVATLNGRLAVRERPGEPTVGSGEIRVAGTYKAYGQDLTIQRGQLLYSATPLSNPRLNIEATRQVDEVTAGLRVRGSAQAPELTVFSDPPMGQANALSYLVAGKPLEDIGSNDGESDALQAASRSLGAAAGGLLAKNVGRRLGVDELAVKDEEQLGGAALTVGQYLSPRLYLSYGVGLFEPGDIVTLRYKLSKELALQTQRGPQDTRAGIEYRIER